MIHQKVVTKDEVLLRRLIHSNLLVLLPVSAFEIVYIFVYFSHPILSLSLISLEMVKRTNILHAFLFFNAHCMFRSSQSPS
jgi:hypothetical protein